MNPTVKKILLLVLMFCSIVFASIALIGINQDYSSASIRTETNETANSIITANENDIAFPAKNINDYAVIVERPLFAIDRKPYALPPIEKTKEIKTQPKTVKNALDTGKLSLNAVLLSGDKKLALILDEKNNSLARVYEGEKINGWKIKAVESHAAILTKGTDEMLLELEIKPNKPSRNKSNNNTTIKDKNNQAAHVELDSKNNQSTNKEIGTSNNDN